MTTYTSKTLAHSLSRNQRIIVRGRVGRVEQHPTRHGGVVTAVVTWLTSLDTVELTFGVNESITLAI